MIKFFLFFGFSLATILHRFLSEYEKDFIYRTIYDNMVLVKNEDNNTKNSYSIEDLIFQDMRNNNYILDQLIHTCGIQDVDDFKLVVSVLKDVLKSIPENILGDIFRSIENKNALTTEKEFIITTEFLFSVISSPFMVKYLNFLGVSFKSRLSNFLYLLVFLERYREHQKSRKNLFIFVLETFGQIQFHYDIISDQDKVDFVLNKFNFMTKEENIHSLKELFLLEISKPTPAGLQTGNESNIYYKFLSYNLIFRYNMYMNTLLGAINAKDSDYWFKESMERLSELAGKFGNSKVAKIVQELVNELPNTNPASLLRKMPVREEKFLIGKDTSEFYYFLPYSINLFIRRFFQNGQNINFHFPVLKLATEYQTFLSLLKRTKKLTEVIDKLFLPFKEKIEEIVTSTITSNNESNHFESLALAFIRFADRLCHCKLIQKPFSTNAYQNEIKLNLIEEMEQYLQLLPVYIRSFKEKDDKSIKEWIAFLIEEVNFIGISIVEWSRLEIQSYCCSVLYLYLAPNCSIKEFLIALNAMWNALEKTKELT